MVKVKTTQPDGDNPLRGTSSRAILRPIGVSVYNVPDQQVVSMDIEQDGHFFVVPLSPLAAKQLGRELRKAAKAHWKLVSETE